MRINHPKNKKTKLVIAGFVFISFAVLVAGGILFNPICLGAGVAGLCLSCSALIGLHRPTPPHPYV